MFCSDCPQRNTCETICPELETHLHSLEVYQRELPFDPGRLESLAERVSWTWPDLLGDSPWFWEALFELMGALPDTLMRPFILHYYEGRSLPEVSRILRIHRVSVSRRLERAIVMLRREVARQKRIRKSRQLKEKKKKGE